MKKFHIYTDASSKDTTMYPGGRLKTTKVGVIVVDSHIFDIYYNREEKFIDSSRAEKQAIIESVRYIKSKFKAKNIIVHTDAFLLNLVKKRYYILKM